MGEEVFRGQIYEHIMPQKIDLIDRKILWLLSKNARYSNTAIAKALRIKREVVAYRIKIMIENKVINGFFTLIDTRKMGYYVYVVYMKLKTLTHEKEMIDFLVATPEVSVVSGCSGMYDLHFEITTQALEDFDRVFSKIFDKYREVIHDYLVLNFLREDSTGRGFLVDVEEVKSSGIDKFKEIKGSCFQKDFDQQNKSHFIVNIDELDKQILSAVNHNSRLTIREISEKLKVSPSTVEQRKRKLIKDGVIKRFLPLINFSHFNVQWYAVFFYMKDLDESKLVTYLQEEPHTLWYVKYVGKWNYQINIFAENNSHFHDVLNKIRNTFSDNIMNFESIIMFNQYKRGAVFL
ncbi:Lrp/AsnC family transcriptional regulator [Candidatus Woesearchaeota archaeon]|nr:Lrp/AsnC family transcriptional regulator [Candidatus Woesearchaeota archaeon]